MEEHKFEHGCYLNRKEVQEWLLGLGYAWLNGKGKAMYLDSTFLYTTPRGELLHGIAQPREKDLPLKTMPVAVHEPIQEPIHEPHPYQPIIDDLTEAKTEGWEQAVSWLGNVSLEKVKFMRGGMRGDIADLFSAFTWANTPQRHKFWAKQRMGLN